MVQWLPLGEKFSAILHKYLVKQIKVRHGCEKNFLQNPAFTSKPSLKALKQQIPDICRVFSDSPPVVKTDASSLFTPHRIAMARITYSYNWNLLTNGKEKESPNPKPKWPLPRKSKCGVEIQSPFMKVDGCWAVAPGGAWGQNQSR
jgi:hypothetical protein